jgi:ABC-type antimicrobial peptide transport system permease subunit
MKKNMGVIDRAIRTMIAAVLVILFMTNVITGTLAIILLAFAVIFLLTSLIGTCPLYLPFGISTAKKEM